MKPTKSPVIKGSVVLAVICFCAAAQAREAGAARDLFVTAGKSLVVDSPVVIQRVAVSNPRARRGSRRDAARGSG